MFNGFPTTVTMSPERQARWENWPGYGGNTMQAPTGDGRVPGGRQATYTGAGMPTTPAVPTQVAPVPQQTGQVPGMNYATQPGGYQPILQQAASGQPLSPASFNMMSSMAGASPFARYMSPQYNSYISPEVIKQFMGNMGGGGMNPMANGLAGNMFGAIQGYGARLQPNMGGAIAGMYGNQNANFIPMTSSLVQYRPMM